MLGGISKLGGTNAEQLLTKVAGIDNAVWRVAAAAGVKIGSEVTEEITALLTAITTGIVEGRDIASYSSKNIKALVEQSKEQIKADGEKALQSGKMPDDAHLEIMELNSAQYAANADAANPTAAQTTVEPVQSPTERDIINTTQLWTQQPNEAAGIQSEEVQMVNIDDVDGSSQQESEHGAIVTAFNIDEIRPQLKTESNTAFFWSGNTDGVGGAKVAADIASTKNGVTLESLIDSKGISMPIWDLSDQSSVKAWDMASAAYAEQVVGEVRAIVGAKLRPGNIWENVELPRLKANPNVTRIIIIDPKTGIETTIFER